MAHRAAAMSIPLDPGPGCRPPSWLLSPDLTDDVGEATLTRYPDARWERLVRGQRITVTHGDFTREYRVTGIDRDERNGHETYMLEPAEQVSNADPSAAGYPDGAGEFLHSMLSPAPRPGPPFVHTLRLPETEEELAAAPYTPQFSVSTEDQAEPQ